MAYARRVMEGKIDGYSLEKRYVGADGGPVWVSLSVSLVRDAAGNPPYFVDQIQDITGRKLAEKQLMTARPTKNTVALPTRITLLAVLLDMTCSLSFARQ